MATGFVLVQVASGKEKAVYEALKEVDDVEEIHPLFGAYDFIIKLESKDYDAMGQLVVDSVRRVDGVENTQTLTVTSL